MSPLYATKKKIQKLSHTPIIVAVPTNEVGIWGGGLALTFKRLFPELPRLQHALMKTHPECMGDTYLQYAYMSNDVSIQAFPTKGKIQSKSSIEKIRRQMVFSLSQFLEKPMLVIPKLGAGLGGLYWGEVSTDLQTYQPDNTSIVVCDEYIDVNTIRREDLPKILKYEVVDALSGQIVWRATFHNEDHHGDLQSLNRFYENGGIHTESLKRLAI